MIPDYTVKIQGHVKKPGKYKLVENMTIYDLIFQYGGFIDQEFRSKTYLDRAELVRFVKDSLDKEIISFNLQDALDQKEIGKMTLRANDVVTVFSKVEILGEKQFVKLSGHVKKPGTYELYEKNMTIYDLLFKGGGFDDNLFLSTTFLNRADLLRYDEERITQSIIPFNLGLVLSNKDSSDNLELMPGDEIIIYPESYFNHLGTVEINGVVKNEGNYSLKSNMSVEDLILEAGGLNEGVYRFRVEVARIDPKNESLKEQVSIITFDIDQKFSIDKNDYTDLNELGYINQTKFILKPYDIVSIRPDPYFSKQNTFTISGMVLYPGEYVIKNQSETIKDIIKRAGGLKSTAYLEASIFKRQGQR